MTTDNLLTHERIAAAKLWIMDKDYSSSFTVWQTILAALDAANNSAKGAK